jgi:radical SAM superfamily enzyme YgiQ (UPF0313 family)
VSESKEQYRVVLVALYRFLNFSVRILHPLLEKIEGVKTSSIFYLDYESVGGVYRPPTKTEEELFIKKIIELKPHLVGFSVLSPYFSIARRLTGLIRENTDALVLWGGIHATISPDACIEEADIICMGEGEGALVDLVTSLRDGKEYNGINNLWINSGGGVIKNPMRPLIQDLDSIPFLSYSNDSYFFIKSDQITQNDEIMNTEHYWVKASRGCPFVCTYCVNSLLRPLFKDLGNYSRVRSVKSIISEMRQFLDSYGEKKKSIIFVDEVFGTSESWLDEFGLAYRKEIGLPFAIEYHPKILSAGLLQKIVSTGVSEIGFGIQNGSDYIRNKIFHRPGKNSDIVSVAKEITKYGVKCRYDLILDNPYDDEESLRNAIDLLLQLPKPLLFHIYSMQYFPGYPFTEKAVKDGHVRQEDVGIDSLFKRSLTDWSYVPKLLPFSQKRILQNLIWLIVRNHISDDTVKAAMSEMFYSGFLLYLIHLKAFVLGQLLGTTGLIGYGGLLKGRVGVTIIRLKILFGYLSRGEFVQLYSRLTSKIAKMRSRN